MPVYADKIIRSRHAEGGFSLPTVMILVVLFGIMAVAMSRIITRTQKASKSTEMRMDLKSLKTAVLSDFSCFASLGEPSTDVALSCGDYTSIPIKRQDGSLMTTASGHIGSWTVTAGCVNDQIIFKAMKPGKDPLTGTLWSQARILRDASMNLDLFRGTRGFCRAYFVPPTNIDCAGAGYTGPHIVSGIRVSGHKAKLVCDPGWQFGGIASNYISDPVTGAATSPCLPDIDPSHPVNCHCPSGYIPRKVMDFTRHCYSDQDLGIGPNDNVANPNDVAADFTCGQYQDGILGHRVHGADYGMESYVCIKIGDEP